MAYECQNFKNGQVLTAECLNKIDTWLEYICGKEIVSGEINGNGELVFTLCNGEQMNLGTVSSGGSGGGGQDGLVITDVITIVDDTGKETHRLTLSDGRVLEVSDGADGVAGKDGSNGKDGVSATHSWNGTTLTITSASGTSSADLKGNTGEAGSDGVGIKSVAQTTTSSADGGSNVITVTKTDDTTSTFTVKNGSKGSDGNDGKSAYEYARDAGYTGTEAEFAEKLASEENETKVATPDFSANEGEDGYILNRTHYVDNNGIVHKLDNKFIDADWMATSEDYTDVDTIIPEQTASTTWSNLQYNLQPDVVYDVYVNGTVYPCTAIASGSQAVVLGNHSLMSASSTLPNNNEPFCIYWAGGTATMGMFYEDSERLVSPITIKVTEHSYVFYNKLPEGFLPECVVKSVNGITPDENGNVEIEVSGGGADVSSVEPMEDDIPKVFLTGDEFSDMTADKNEVNMELEYRSKSKEFHAYILIKYQGRSSLSKPKKNFTIKMYSDEARESKVKLAFKDWGVKKHKYVLKANFIDHTHARNIIGANLWSEVVASRSDYDTLPEEMRNSPRNGAVDGFPIKLYVNGTYQGIYTWNIGKDDWMWGMDEDNANHILLSNEGDQGSSVVNAGNFRKVWNGEDGSHWSLEVGTNSTALKTSLNNLITFVMNNNGNAFKNGIGNYLDVQSAIDYYIHQYVICNIDSLALNMLLATYDGTLWRCGAYDMDSTFGLWWTGEKFLPATYKCPEDYQDKFSLLWERLEENYWTEIQTRYAELRKTVYSPANMFTHFERFTDVIGNDLYAEDLEVYPTIPQGSTCNVKQLRNFIRDRLAYCDSQITNGIPGTAVTLSATELTIDSNSGGSATLTATKTPSNATDDIYWYSSDTAVATVANGVVSGVADGSCTIYAKCGSGYASCAVTVTSVVEPDVPDEPETSYTNLVPTSIDTNGSVYNGTGYKDGYRLSSSGSVSSTAVSTATHTGFMKFTKGDVIRVKDTGGWTYSDSVSGNYFNFYNTSFGLVKADYPENYVGGTVGTTETLSDGSTLITLLTANNQSLPNGTEYYLRVSLNPAKGANLIVTVNQEITA